MEFIERRGAGVFVKDSRVSLASIIHAFRAGDSPETIQRNFDSLSLAQVYGAIAHVLNNPAESEAYLAEVEGQWEALESRAKPLLKDAARR